MCALYVLLYIVAGGDHSGGVLNGEVLFLLDGVVVADTVVAIPVVLDGIAAGELWWCLIQCALAKTCLCLLVSGFDLLLLLGLRCLFILLHDIEPREKSRNCSSCFA